MFRYPACTKIPRIISKLMAGDHPKKKKISRDHALLGVETRGMEKPLLSFAHCVHRSLLFSFKVQGSVIDRASLSQWE